MRLFPTLSEMAMSKNERNEMSSRYYLPGSDSERG